MRIITACHHRHGPKLSSLHLSQASTSGLCFTWEHQYVAFAPAVLTMCSYMSQYDMNYSIYISHDPLPVQAVSQIQFGLRTNCLHQMFAIFGHTSFSQIGVITIVLLFLHQSVARVILDDFCGQLRPWNLYISASSHYVRDLCLNEFPHRCRLTPSWLHEKILVAVSPKLPCIKSFCLIIYIDGIFTQQNSSSDFIKLHSENNVAESQVDLSWALWMHVILTVQRLTFMAYL